MPDYTLGTAEKEALTHFKAKLQLLLGDNLLSLRLFGSRVRGEGTEESDLDVLVVVGEKDRTVCRRIIEESLEIDLAYGTNLAPTILCKDEYEQNKDYQTPFYCNLERESLPL